MYFTRSKISKTLGIAICLLANFSAAAQLGSKKYAALGELMESSQVFQQSFTGLVLFDPETEEFLYERFPDNHFTPASNTKIFTFYTALKVLGDSIPALRYVVTGDSLIFWGTGNPLFLHPDFEQDTTVMTFLKSRPEKLFFSGHNFRDEAYGPGWSWDDYNSSYQPERSPFPIYGNMAHFERKNVRDGFSASPAYFNDKIVFNSNLDLPRPRLQRRYDENTFEYNPRALTGLPFKQSLFFRYSPQLVADLLSDTLGRKVGVADLNKVRPSAAHTINISLPDTLYQQLMQDSDNFIAEQLLLVCSEKLFGTQKAADAIEYATRHLFRDAPAALKWVDGSGLSRYNLFTPRTVVGVLHKIYRELPTEKRNRIFANGGKTGTIQGWYKNREPYVFAKTGTLSNVHCLSGFVKTKDGKTLIFSFMHNNYTSNSSTIKREMEKMLVWIKDNN